ncbi:AsmA family protein [Paucibacter soli]|uniref:AsmA family protein n=1 Tax=Paucibacter soli TaxID=3133433 RepID=UPI0030A7BE44
MRLPSQHRGRWALAAGLLLLAGGLTLGEVLGWPWLAAPLERLLSNRLGQPVTIERRGFELGLLGGVSLRSAEMRVAAPAWSAAPQLLLAQDIWVRLGYLDLLRTQFGQPLRVQRWQARRLDAHIERLADGRASWQFGVQAPEGQSLPVLLPELGEVEVSQASMLYHDALGGLHLQARWSLQEDLAHPEERFKLEANGQFHELPLQLTLSAAGLLPWLGDGEGALAVPVKLQATVGRARFGFEGTATDVRHLGALDGRFRLDGPSLAAVGDPLGVTLPSTAAFRSEGAMRKQGQTWRVVLDDFRVGASRLRGVFNYDAGRSQPLLTGQLIGRRLLLADLGPALGSTSAVAASDAPASAPTLLVAPRRGPGHVLPARPFDLAALRRMDAEVSVDIAELDLGSRYLDALRPLQALLSLQSGMLRLHALNARLAQGRLSGALQLDGRGEQALWSADLNWQDVRLERWVRQERSLAKAPPWLSGQLRGQAQLHGQGRSTAEILASLQGRVRSELLEGTVSHLAIEAAGLDLAQGLGVALKGDDALTLPCAVADLQAKAGVLSPRVLVMDTRDSTVWVDGTLSLRQEALDLRVLVSPKDFSPLTLRAPLRVQGQLAAPTLTVDKGPIAAKLAGSLLLGLINPLAALLPLIDLGDGPGARHAAQACEAASRQIGS